MKSFQLFIHRYYDSIKLILLAVILGFCMLIFASDIASKYQDVSRNNKQSAERATAVKNILSSIKNENDKQTVIINQQIRALCVVIIETAGQEGLNKLDPQSAERCKNLASANQPYGTNVSTTPSHPNQKSSTSKTQEPTTSNPPADDSKSGNNPGSSRSVSSGIEQTIKGITDAPVDFLNRTLTGLEQVLIRR